MEIAHDNGILPCRGQSFLAHEGNAWLMKCPCPQRQGAVRTLALLGAEPPVTTSTAETDIINRNTVNQSRITSINPTTHVAAADSLTHSPHARE
jgi:hypothetical protein